MSNISHEQLWAAIEGFSIDGEGVQGPFVQRLARQHGWTLEYGERAVEEYKRFVYLAMVSPTEVTPSGIVDNVWHLHLTFSVSYWERLAPLLPRKLHHHPSKGGRAEDGRIASQYAKTLGLYQDVFGTAAPTDLWPRTSERPPSLSATVPVDPGTHWILEKRRAGHLVAVAAATALVTAGAGCAPLLAQQDMGGFGAALIGAGVTVVVVLIIAALINAKKKRGLGAPGGSFHSGVGPAFGSSGFVHGDYAPGDSPGDSSGSAHSADGGPSHHGSDASTDGTDSGQSAVSGPSSDSSSSSGSDSSSGGDSSSGCGGGGCGGGGGD